MKNLNIRSVLKTCFGISAILILAACAGREKPVLTLTAKQAMSQSKIAIVNDHQEIEADIEGSNATAAMGGGLLFAALDIANMVRQQKEQESYLEPVLANVQSKTVFPELKNQLEAAFQQTPKFEFKGIEIEDDQTKNFVQENQGQYDGLAILTPRFRFSEDLSTLKSSLQVEFFATSPAFKTALKVSEKFSDTFAEQTLNESFSPIGVKHALPTDIALKDSLRKEIRGNDVFMDDKTLMNKTDSAFRKLRTETKENNVKIWAAENGKPIKDALIKAHESLTKQALQYFRTLFPEVNAKS